MEAVRISVSNRPGLYFLVDQDIAQKIHPWRWMMDTRGYICRTVWCKETKRRVRIYLHHFVAGRPRTRKHVIDHINSDRLDMRRANLRECLFTQNLKNKKKREGTRSKYIGVIPTANGKWKAQITVKALTRYLGTFPTEEMAGRAYDFAAERLHDGFAKLNFADGKGFISEQAQN